MVFVSRTLGTDEESEAEWYNSIREVVDRKVGSWSAFVSCPFLLRRRGGFLVVMLVEEKKVVVDNDELRSGRRGWLD